MRFFAASDAVYESARNALNEAWGLPDGITESCIVRSQHAPHANGLALLAVNDEFCTWPPADSMLAEMLAAGLVTEIEQSLYLAALAANRD